MKNFPIPTYRIRLAFGNPLSKEEVDEILENGVGEFCVKNGYGTDLVGLFSALSIATIMIHEITIRLLDEMKEYLETHDDGHVRIVAFELQKRMFELVYRNNIPVVHLRGNDEKDEWKRRIPVLSQADQTEKILVPYLEAIQMMKFWKSGNYVNALPSILYIKQMISELRNAIMIVAAHGCRISSMDPDLSIAWMLYLGAPAIVFDKKGELVEEEDENGLIELASAAYVAVAFSMVALQKELQNQAKGICYRMSDPDHLDQAEADHKLHFEIVRILSTLKAMINGVLDDAEGEKLDAAGLRRRLIECKGRFIEPFLSILDKVTELGLRGEIHVMPDISDRLKDLMDFYQKLEQIPSV